MYLNICKLISDLEQAVKMMSHIVAWFWVVLFFKVIFEGMLPYSPCHQRGSSRMPGVLPEKSVMALQRESGVGLQGVVLVSRSAHCAWHHFWLLRIWEGTVLPVKLDTTLKSSEILTCVSILSAHNQVFWWFFFPCCWIYILQTKVPSPPPLFCIMIGILCFSMRKQGIGISL